MPAPGLFNVLDSVDSTNNYAMGRIHAGLASHGMAWFTTHQTGGKGQRGKNWESEPGKNIAMSLILEAIPFRPYGQFYLSASMALACFDLFWAYAGDETKIKWPNDLYWRDRKAGGILIENIYHGRYWKWAVAGVGININQCSFDTVPGNPVSLKEITGRELDVPELGKELYHRMMDRAHGAGIKNPGELMEEYNEKLYKKNEKVRLKKENMIFETAINGVNAQGQLLTTDVMERKFYFGEVTWML